MKWNVWLYFQVLNEIFDIFNFFKIYLIFNFFLIFFFNISKAKILPFCEV